MSRSLPLSLCCLCLVGLSAADPLGQADALEKKALRAASASQARVEGLDRRTREQLETYRALQARLRAEQAYGRELQARLDAQETELAGLQRQIEQSRELRGALEPLMGQMLRGLEGLVAADLPFLPEERRERLARLREMLETRRDPVAERFRRLLDAYRVEAGYGSTIEAYEGDLTEAGEVRRVLYFRLGRTALYYLTLDGARGGLWDADAGAWRPLGLTDLPGLQQAVRMARRQSAPGLLTLPLPAVPAS